MQDQVGLAGLVEGRGERVHQLADRVADEPDGVGQQAPRARRAGTRRVVGSSVSKRAVVHALRRRPSTRSSRLRLAGIGVPGQRQPRVSRESARAGALGLPRAGHVLQPPAQRRHAVAQQPPVRLELGLAGAPRARRRRRGAQGAATGPPWREYEYSSCASSTCSLPSAGVGVLGEDVEDHRGAVDHPDLQAVLQVALLPGAEGALGGHQGRASHAPRSRPAPRACRGPGTSAAPGARGAGRPWRPRPAGLRSSSRTPRCGRRPRRRRGRARRPPRRAPAHDHPLLLRPRRQPR